MKKRENLPAAICIRDHGAIKRAYHAILECWPVAMEKVYIPTSFGRTLCVRSGDRSRPPMILIHGSMSNSASWMADIGKLNERYHTCCLDIPGDPGGSEDRRFSWNGPHFSRWIAECMDSLDIPNAAIGGLSLGGWAALRFAIDHPERVTRLFLLAPAGVGPIKVFTVLKLMFYSLAGKWGQEKILKMIFGEKEITQQVRDFFILTTGNCRPRYGNPPPFSDAELSSIEVPVIYIGGEDDPLIDTKKTSDRLAQNIRNLKCILLRDSHALVQLERDVFDLLA